MVKLHRSVLVIITVLLASAASLCAQAAAPPDLDSYVANSMKTFDVPGMAVAIVKDGRSSSRKGTACASWVILLR